MTNFATFIDTANGKAPVAQRGKAKQKRSDLRLVGLGLVVTRDGGIPLTWHAYPGDRPDVTQFPAMIDQLLSQYQAVCAAAAVPDGAADMTVVFDAGQNSEGNFAHLASTGLRYVGSVPAQRLPGPDRPARQRAHHRRSGPVRRADRATTPAARSTAPSGAPSSPTPRSCTPPRLAGSTAPRWPRPARSSASWPPPWPAAKPAAAGTRWKPRSSQSPANPGSAGSSPGSSPATSPKTCASPGKPTRAARAALEEEIFGKHVLITDHDDWPVPEVIAGYRSQSEAEFSFRQLKDTRVVSFSPMHHWTEHNIRVHVFTCVLALQLAHLMRRQARHAGLALSVRELLSQLAAIGETVLIYPSTGGLPKARRMTTELSDQQRKLHEIFNLAPWAPPS